MRLDDIGIGNGLGKTANNKQFTGLGKTANNKQFTNAKRWQIDNLRWAVSAYR